jgi:hypothetical protein
MKNTDCAVYLTVIKNNVNLPFLPPVLKDEKEDFRNHL